MQENQKKDPAAVKLGRRGGRAGTGQAKSRSEQVRAWWASAQGQAERVRRKTKAQSSTPTQ